MPRYRWVGPNTVEIPDAGVTVAPDQEFDCAKELDHPYIVLAGAKPSKLPHPED